MNFKKYLNAILLILISIILLIGCNNYAKLVYEDKYKAELSINNIIENWDDYYIYYSGYDVDNVAGVLFDPKGDDKTLTPTDRWIRVESKDTVSELMEWINLYDYPGYSPRLFKVLGPDDNLYGYVYTGWHRVVAKVVDEKTMLVFDLPDPPHYYGPGSEVINPAP